MKYPALCLVPLFAALVLFQSGCSGSGPDPEELLDRVVAQFESDFAGVDSFLVRSGTARLYYRRSDDDSLAAFDLEAFAGDSLDQRPIYDPYHLPNISGLVTGLRNNATYMEANSINDVAVHVLRAINPKALVGEGADAGIGPDDATIAIDQQTYRVIEITLVASPEEESDPWTQRYQYDDYRTMGGITIPFTSSITVEGIEITQEMRMAEGAQISMERGQVEQWPDGPEKEARLSELEQRQRYLTEGIIEDVFEVDSVLVHIETSSRD